MVVAAALLPIVEQVEPDRLAGFLGRTLMRRPAATRPLATSTRWPGPPPAGDAGRAVRSRPGRADPPAELDNVGAHGGASAWTLVTPNALAALALIDPRRAVAMVEALPDDPAIGRHQRRHQVPARHSLAKLLALHGDDRWRLVYQQLLYLWTPDQRYL